MMGGDQSSADIALALTFALGLGQALVIPSWQAIQPELVSRAEVPLAATLHGVNVNLARAVGPAIGGFVIAHFGRECVGVTSRDVWRVADEQIKSRHARIALPRNRLRQRLR